MIGCSYPTLMLFKQVQTMQQFGLVILDEFLVIIKPTGTRITLEDHNSAAVFIVGSPVIPE